MVYEIFSVDKFAVAVVDLLGGDVHCMLKTPSAAVLVEGVCSFYVLDRVLSDIGVGLISREHHVGWVEG